MRWLLFLSRLAFICGFCILLHISFLFFGDWIKEENIIRTILVIGYGIGFVVIPVTVVSYIVVLIIKKRVPVPYWLIVANIIFLVAILFFIILNNQGNAENTFAP
jgi:hypothetical protein